MGPDVMDKDGSSSPEELEMSDEEDRLEERRRRFCMERRQELAPNDSTAKPIRSIKSIRPGLRTPRDMKRSRNDNYSNIASNKRRRMVGYNHQNPYPQPHHHLQQQVEQYPHHHRASNLTVVKVSNEPPRQGPVIFINPSFVKKFLEKYIKLASNTASATNTTTTNNNTFSFHRQTAANNHLSHFSKATSGLEPSTSSATPNSATTMIEGVDSFKTCPLGSLQAACTMAIIRLVTDCIEDDNKRDERYNKRLVAQLLEKLRSVE